MSDRTSIEWARGDDGTPGATWNPVTGCTKVSPGCDHCYAETFAERWRGTLGHYYERGFDVQLRPAKLDQPMRWRRPRRIFVNSMSDLFHDAIPDEYIARVFAVMAAAPWHTFQVLTKRHARMRALLSARLGEAGFVDQVEEAMADFTHASLDTWPLRNVWLGVSVEDQKWANIRIPALLDTPAAVRWLSCEPLLGPLNLRTGQYAMPPHGEFFGTSLEAIDWVVVGGESGRGARPMRESWVHMLAGQCRSAGVPFFFKQAGAILAKDWGCAGKKGGDPADWPYPFPREYPAGHEVPA